jgi:transposase InsO family protein
LKLDVEVRVSAAVKAEVIAWVDKTRRRSGWALQRILAALGVSRSRYYEWRDRQEDERLQDAPARRAPLSRLLEEERQAICAYAQRHPKIGYRKLTWMMIDAGIVAVDESSVYRVLKDADLLYRFKRSAPSDGQYRFRPTAPNQQWHTDVMYVWVTGCWYFLVSFIDAYSRYVVHHRLLLELNGRAMASELQAALDGNPGAKPRVVHDHGAEYVNRDLAAVIKAHNLLDIRTRRRHPESNGIAERFNGTVREETGDDYGANYLEAEATIARLVTDYNEQRLHAALGYMQPAVWHRGNPQARRVERADKLRSAKTLRRAINKQRHEEALAA